ncbi:MAG: IS1595 family transposase [Pseudomonadales bacterium]|nr:IS1595 family transposase [Pseudomonadales bacterium]
MKFTVKDFFKQFPDDDACLEHLMETRFGKSFECPKCAKESKFHRLANLPAYSCQYCGHHIHPMVGTPFAKSRTPLQLWFYAIFLFTTSKHGVPAKELQRQLGITYKTAWRIGHEIRKYISGKDNEEPLSGHVEIDETYVGGKLKGGKRGRGAAENKTIVLGMMERDGRIALEVVDTVRQDEVLPHIIDHVKEGATISTDENRTYHPLTKLGYKHEKVQHNEGEWVRGEVHTNNIESFWNIFKRSVKSTHVHVSKQHMQKYLDEFEYRFNMRKETHGHMFDDLINGFAAGRDD